MRPPPPQRAVCRLCSRSESVATLKRTSGWTSPAMRPSLVTIITCFSSSMKLTSTRAMLGSYARAARSARRIKSTLSAGATVTVLALGA